MAKVIPYRPFFYSSTYRAKLGDLVSPPYDVISADDFQKLKNLNEHNSVRLCLAENPGDPERYIKMKSLFSAWKDEKVFETAASPSFCIIEETFSSGGIARQRIGFVGLIESTPFEQRQVLPHEHTLSGPKADRLELLKNLGAELSQVFFCYKDSSLVLEKLHQRISTQKPFEEGMDPQGVARKVWLLSDPSEVKKLQELLDTKSVLIADGHHRYETSVHFRIWDGTLKSEYVQGYFTNLDSPGFTILPIHRIFSLPEDISPASFQRRLEQAFEVEAFSDPLDLKTLDRYRDSQTLALFCALRDPDRILLLKRKKSDDKDAEIFAIHKYIFEEILDWDVTKLSKGTIQYEHETNAFKQSLTKLNRGAGLFLPATDLNLVMDLAQRGERMPQKSTFFFPKLASGLVNYELGSY